MAAGPVSGTARYWLAASHGREVRRTVGAMPMPASSAARNASIRAWARGASSGRWACRVMSPADRCGQSRSAYRSASAESTALFAICQSMKLPARRTKSASVSRSHGQLTSAMCRAPGGRGSRLAGSASDASGERIQYRVITPKFPPPPPVWAHQRSLFGSVSSRVATTVDTFRSWSTTTTSTAYRWSTLSPSSRDSGPQPPPLMCPPAPTPIQNPTGTVTPQLWKRVCSIFPTGAPASMTKALRSRS